jgi:hypothetical protein
VSKVPELYVTVNVKHEIMIELCLAGHFYHTRAVTRPSGITRTVTGSKTVSGFQSIIFGIKVLSSGSQLESLHSRLILE